MKRIKFPIAVKLTFSFAIVALLPMALIALFAFRSLIASQAFGNMAGASYTFLDSSAQGGVIYYYWLQDVEASGGTSALYNGIHALGAARRPVPARLPGRTIDF